MADNENTSCIAAHLAGAIQYATVSHADPQQVDWSTFDGLREYLQSTYPHLHAALDCTVVGRSSLLYHWRGGRGKAPLALTAHLDVVPAPGNWRHPPFAGVIDDQFVWGRGAIDDKHQLVFQMEAVESLLAAGFRPSCSIYLCYGHNEEVEQYPSGAGSLAEELRSRGAAPGLLLDEGGAVRPDTLLGTGQDLAVAAVGEKGYADVRLVCEDPGGHAATPMGPGAAGRVAAAALQILGMKPHRAVLPVLRQMAVAAGADEGAWAEASHTAWGNALTATTTALTVLRAGDRPNVLPGRAEAVFNCRLLPGDTVQSLLARMRGAMTDDGVAVELLRGIDPPPVSDWNSDAFECFRNACARIFPGVPVCPSLATGMTDARHYAGLAAQVIRFMPVHLPEEIRRTMHGVDERIPLEALEPGVAFYKELIRLYAG